MLKGVTAPKLVQMRRYLTYCIQHRIPRFVMKNIWLVGVRTEESIRRKLAFQQVKTWICTAWQVLLLYMFSVTHCWSATCSSTGLEEESVSSPLYNFIEIISSLGLSECVFKQIGRNYLQTSVGFVCPVKHKLSANGGSLFLQHWLKCMDKNHGWVFDLILYFIISG